MVASMSSPRVQWFSQARHLLRVHPELTDEEIALELGVPRAEIRNFVVPARREV